jgi:microcystin-dependent protein
MNSRKQRKLMICIVILLLVGLIIINYNNNKKDKVDDNKTNTTSSNIKASSIASDVLNNTASYNNLLLSDSNGNITSMGFPIGTIIMWNPIVDGKTQESIPYGWAVCDGSKITINRNGVPFEYQTPDLRGRFVVGTNDPTWNNTQTGLPVTLNNKNTIPKYLRDDGTMINLINYRLGQTGGEEQHLLTEAEMPNHTHQHKDTVFAESGGVYNDWKSQDNQTLQQRGIYAEDPTGNGTIGLKSNRDLGVGADNDNWFYYRWLTTLSKGGGQPHWTLPPFYSLIYLVKVF